MKLTDAISKIHAPKGVSSVIAGFMAGDLSPIQQQVATGVSLATARRELEKVNQAQRDCNSDWAYWGYAGDIAYWSCVVSLLEAAELVGADNLPDVPLPSLSGIVMDVQYNLEQWGRTVLEKAQEIAK